MLLCAIVFLALFYFALTQIGLGLKILFPRLDTFHDTDDIFVYAVNYLLQSRFSGFFLISVIGACLSTANSQLLLIGSMLSYDVAGQFGKNGMKEDKLLGRAKWFIFIGGTLALILSLNPPEDILFFGAAFNLRGAVISERNKGRGLRFIYRGHNLCGSVMGQDHQGILGLPGHSLFCSGIPCNSVFPEENRR